MNRNNRAQSSQESVNKKESATGDADREGNETINSADSSPLSAIRTKNRFSVLHSQESCLSRIQQHPQIGTIKETIIIRKKNENLRKKASSHTASQEITGKSHVRKRIKDGSRERYTIINENLNVPGVAQRNGQCISSGNATEKPENADEQRTLTPQPPTNRDKSPPIYIINQDQKETVKLFEETLNINSFHIKRIHADKHVLFLRSIPVFNKAKEIVIATKTGFTHVHPNQRSTIRSY